MVRGTQRNKEGLRGTHTGREGLTDLPKTNCQETVVASESPGDDSEKRVKATVWSQEIVTEKGEREDRDGAGGGGSAAESSGLNNSETKKGDRT